VTSELMQSATCLDISSAEVVAAHLAERIEPGAAFRIDTSGWTACDLAGVGILLSALRTAAARGARLELALPEDGVVLGQMRACGIDPECQLDFCGGLCTGIAHDHTEGD